MNTLFKNKEGKIFAPDFFAVYELKNGKTIKRVQSDLHVDDLDRYENVRRVILFKNSKDANLTPECVDYYDAH